MAFSNSFVSLMIIFNMFLVLLMINHVRSDFSFKFPDDPNVVNQIGFTNDAAISGDAKSILLTKRDADGNAIQHSVGQATLTQPITIYDKTKGQVADFTVEISFVVDRQNRVEYGDGFAFFFVPTDFNFPDPKASGGGFLGLFTSAGNSDTPILAIEFDSFSNEWDPNPVSQIPHVGIDVNSVTSVVTSRWLSDHKPNGMTATSTIIYNANSQQLIVSLTYADGSNGIVDSVLAYNIDLTTVLPEQVKIGLSAGTGDLVETHDIFYWSFTSNM